MPHILFEIVQLTRSLLPLTILSTPPKRVTSPVHHAPCYHRVVIKLEFPIEEILYEDVLLSHPFGLWPILSILTGL